MRSVNEVFRRPYGRHRPTGSRVGVASIRQVQMIRDLQGQGHLTLTPEVENALKTNTLKVSHASELITRGLEAARAAGASATGTTGNWHDSAAGRAPASDPQKNMLKKLWKKGYWAPPGDWPGKDPRSDPQILDTYLNGVTKGEASLQIDYGLTNQKASKSWNPNDPQAKTTKVQPSGIPPSAVIPQATSVVSDPAASTSSHPKPKVASATSRAAHPKTPSAEDDDDTKEAEEFGGVKPQAVKPIGMVSYDDHRANWIELFRSPTSEDIEKYFVVHPLTVGETRDIAIGYRNRKVGMRFVVDVPRDGIYTLIQNQLRIKQSFRTIQALAKAVDRSLVEVLRRYIAESS